VGWLLLGTSEVGGVVVVAWLGWLVLGGSLARTRSASGRTLTLFPGVVRGSTRAVVAGG
jgi:hypothetical protein